MKKVLIGVMAILWGIAGNVQASLIGDEVLVTHYFPNLQSPNSLVVNGLVTNTDENWCYFTVYCVDVRAESVEVDFLQSGGWNNNASFNGLVLSDLDWVGMPDGVITGLTIDTNMAGWDDTRASFDDHLARFNWQGLFVTNDSYFNATFITDHDISEPSSLALFGMGLLGFGAWRRLQSKE